MIPDILAWIDNSSLGAWVISSPYTWPALESIHFVSLCVLFGSLLIVDLRLLGFYRARCAPMVDFLILPD